ncbi:hypothetical protein SKAU_G00155810 [Synaphobranchus kaupii]|uniref:Uncharacterized protein n=1 Tax=Synaphobranchus kaupii TaxID=118154 RepID=A0A9Q1IYC6_SYNKA|nr:hypothetical protein SKAU_G00155810 [Synaphobranchus kaupii]
MFRTDNMAQEEGKAQTMRKERDMGDGETRNTERVFLKNLTVGVEIEAKKDACTCEQEGEDSEELFQGSDGENEMPPLEGECDENGLMNQEIPKETAARREKQQIAGTIGSSLDEMLLTGSLSKGGNIELGVSQVPRPSKARVNTPKMDKAVSSTKDVSAGNSSRSNEDQRVESAQEAEVPDASTNTMDITVAGEVPESLERDNLSDAGDEMSMANAQVLAARKRGVDIGRVGRGRARGCKVKQIIK